MFDYGTKETNDRERDRVKAEGRAAALAGETCFGAGGYKPGDDTRAMFWLQGYAEVNSNHPDMPARYRTDGGRSFLERLEQ